MSLPELSLYEKRILAVFGERYPDSAQFSGGRKLRKGSWHVTFPEIDKSVEAKNSFLSAVEHLEKQGVISVKWERFRTGDRVAALYLERPGLLYFLLNKSDPETLIAEMREILSSYDPKNSLATKTAAYIIEQLDGNRKLLFQRVQDLYDFLSLLELTPETAARYTIRALSVYLYNDSKRLEAILPGFDKITEAAAGMKISRCLGLERLYPETTMCGSFELVFPNGKRWALINNVVTLPEKTVNEIERVVFETGPAKILSIENKETFYALSSQPGFFHAFIYCGGHLNAADRRMYQLFLESGVQIYHFGDLDPEGLLIFDEIDRALQGALRPFMMNEEIFQRYLAYAYELTPGALKRIDYIENQKLLPLAALIKDAQRGIEQEIIKVEYDSPREEGSLS